MTTQLPNLSRFELQCLRLLWNEEGATVRQVHERLEDPPSYSTVRKIFERLEDKGAVMRVRRDGNAWVYRSTVKPAAMIRKEILRFLDSLFDGAAAPLVAHLAEMDAVSLEDLREIERLAGEEIDERTAEESKNMKSEAPTPRRKDR
jgi:BlaI family penicillinase repressor